MTRVRNSFMRKKATQRPAMAVTNRALLGKPSLPNKTKTYKQHMVDNEGVGGRERLLGSENRALPEKKIPPPP
jgi:hypothetical protein